MEPSLYGADFSRLGEQIEALLDAGCRVFHFDVGDGHFVEPITIGPIVLQSISPLIHERGGAVDVHLMVERPAKYFEAIAAAGGDSVTFHYEAVDDVPATIAAAARARPAGGRRVQPGDGARAGRRGRRRTPISCSACRSIPATRGSRSGRRRSTASRRLRASLPEVIHDPGRRRRRRREHPRAARLRRDALRRCVVDLRARRPAGRVPRARARPARVSISPRGRARCGGRPPGVPEADCRRRDRPGRRGRRRKA